METDPKLLFWTAALANFVLLVGMALLGVRQIRRGRVRRHRRMMLAAAALVALFLVSYGVKVALVGREDRSGWGPGARAVLYVHESFILVMLLAGGFAGRLAWRFRDAVGSGTEVAHDPRPSELRDRARHRRAGWVAVIASALGCAMGAAVLSGMFARS